MKDLQEKIHQNAVEKGFYDQFNFHEKIARTHSEVSEIWEHYRQGKVCHCNELKLDAIRNTSDNSEFKEQYEKHVRDTVEEEFADVIICMLDLAEFMKIDISAHIEMKHRYNTTRERLHGKRF